ncbi:hypothetical protein Sango_0721400 [Sesamum angolense]|uniref:RING-type domain-containing protein n=1 Tax=Sesamum angolense TaxID=2727404 RepID=A0AAE1X244_9LAMI|nr:hypothetical protein Sango_0721400 [Sesamum angolense]
MRNREEKASSGIQASAFTCGIYLEPKPSCQKFEHTKNYFAHEFCMSCVTRHIQAKLEGNISTINCPELTCDQTLDPVDCQAMIPPRLFIQWCDCLCRSVVSGSEKCYCPYMDCSEMILNECYETVKRCLCPGCKRLFCYACRVPWHAGYWCSETHQARDFTETRFGFLLETMNWTRCPGCGSPSSVSLAVVMLCADAADCFAMTVAVHLISTIVDVR